MNENKKESLNQSKKDVQVRRPRRNNMNRKPKSD